MENAFIDTAKSKAEAFIPTLMEVSPKYIAKGPQFFTSPEGTRLTQAIYTAATNFPEVILTANASKNYIEKLSKKLFSLTLSGNYVKEDKSIPEVKEAVEEWRSNPSSNPNLFSLVLAFLHLAVNTKFYSANHKEILLKTAETLNKAEGSELFPQVDNFQFGVEKPTVDQVKAMLGL
jgi:hypothetical protein